MSIPGYAIVVGAYQHDAELRNLLVSIRDGVQNDWALRGIVIVRSGADGPPAELEAEFKSNISTLSRQNALSAKLTFENRKERMNVAQARNLAIMRSPCVDWLFVIDADDTIEPGGLEAIYENARSCDGDVGAVVGSWRGWNGTTLTAPSSMCEVTLENLLAGNYLPPCGMIRRHTWELVRAMNGWGYDQEMGGFEEWMFWLDLLALRYRIVPERRCVWRRTLHAQGERSLLAEAQGERIKWEEMIAAKMLERYGIFKPVRRPTLNAVEGE